MRPLRLGVVSYLNAEPLVFGLDGDPRFELLRDVPSAVAERLHAGELDLGMIPSVEYPRGDYAIVPDVAIASRGPIRSVRLLLQRPLDQVRTVAVDRSSRSSAALLKVLLREWLGYDPDYVPMPPQPAPMLQTADAALLIGDPALYYDTEVASLDLGEEWTRLTGLPFVYAFWAGRPGLLDADELAALQGALREGVQRLAAIGASYDGMGAMHAERNEAYLRGNVVYRLGEEELAGLREFYRRAFEQGLIARIPELRFHGRA